jgi:SanA protein
MAGKSKPRRLLRLAGSALGAGLLVAVLCDLWVDQAAATQVKSQLAALEPAPVALVLGTSRQLVGGGDNAFYFARIKAAAALFTSGKVRGLIVSGDNRTHGYNEPAMMKADLIAAGVPAQYITQDFAGFRTLDSVIRAKAVFGQDRLIVVSQEFHAKRAVFIAQHAGIEAQGFAAEQPAWHWQLRVRAREVLARAAVCLDLWVLNRRPHFLGKREPVGLKPA